MLKGVGSEFRMSSGKRAGRDGLKCAFDAEPWRVELLAEWLFSSSSSLVLACSCSCSSFSIAFLMAWDLSR